jgi:hypothetical protein
VNTSGYTKIEKLETKKGSKGVERKNKMKRQKEKK